MPPSGGILYGACMMKPRLSHTPRAVHLLLITLALWAHVAVAQQGFMNHLRNHKAAAFAWDVIAGEPRLLLILGLPLISIAALYAVYFWLIAVLARPRRISEQGLRAKLIVLLMTWAASIWLLLYLHLHWFPRSIWSWWIEPLFAPPAAVIIDVAAAIWIAFRLSLLVKDLGSAAQRRGSGFSTKTKAVSVLGLVACIVGVWILHSGGAQARSAQAHAQVLPNVIIIGMDSLRRDIAVGKRAAEMPHLARFREQAFIQDNVVSPLARTFPAWVSILTGHPPATSGARDNLVAQQNIPRQDSLGWKLKKLGYRTVYATDETRFSNIGEEFGFDEIVSPQPGAPDFLIGQFADQPLVNFAVQLPFAEYFLPSLVGNRAFAQAYEPSRFVGRLSRSLGYADGRPTAMAIHLCLAHWPYYSARSPSVDANDGYGAYLRSAAELDTQFGELQQELRRLGYLNDRTMVVLLADHGEGLTVAEAEARSIVHHGVDVAPPSPGAGHGASLLAPAQWQVFFMFSGQSAQGAIPRGRSGQLASLADLAPTVMSLVGHPQGDARSLAVVDAVAGTLSSAGKIRDYVALETGFRPKTLNVMQPDGNEALRIAASSFKVLANGRIEMKDEIYQRAIQTKDFGVTDGDQTLALVQTVAEPLLIATDANRTWHVYPRQRPTRSAEAPPLIELACRDAAMSALITTWCHDQAPSKTP